MAERGWGSHWQKPSRGSRELGPTNQDSRLLGPSFLKLFGPVRRAFLAFSSAPRALLLLLLCGRTGDA